MIKLQPPTTQHRQFYNFRCGEVLCIGPTTYHVCCALCGQKILYESFPQHFRLEHLSQSEECKLFDKDGKLVKKGEPMVDAGAPVKVEHDPIAHENNEHENIDLAQIALFDLDDDNDIEDAITVVDVDYDYDNGADGGGQETTWNGSDAAAAAAAAVKLQVAKRSRPKRSGGTQEPSKRRKRVDVNGLIIKTEPLIEEESTTLSKNKYKDDKKTPETFQMDNFTNESDDEKKKDFDQYVVGHGNNKTTDIEYFKNNQQIDNFKYDDDDHEDYDDDESNSNSNYEMAISFPCDECERRYNSRRGLQYHKRTKHNPNLIEKQQTNKKSSSVTAETSSKTKKKNGTAAMPSSSSIRDQYKCSDCDQVFRNERELRGHRWKHTGIKCDICGKPFSQTGNMTRHRIRHSGIKSFKCGECDASFYTNKELNSHKICHTGKMPMICEICGRPCRDRGVLTAHMRRHTGERPAKCDVCGKCFYSFHDLNVHAVSHTSARPFACDICGSTFQRKKALRVHKLLHSGKRKYDCKICGKGFAQYGGLNAHLRIHDASAICAATAIMAMDSSNSKTLAISDISDVAANGISDTDDLIQEVGDSEIALEETTYTNQEHMNNMGTTGVSTSNVTFIMSTV